MSEAWLDRLREVIEADDRSYSKISEDAGLGRNFVQQMLRDGKAPGADRLEKILNTFPQQVAVYVILGLELSAKDIALLSILGGLSTEARADIERLAARLASTERRVR